MITAINVSRSCGLIAPKDEMVILPEENATESVRQCISRIQSGNADSLVVALSGYLLSQVKGMTGVSLNELFQCLCQCKSVLCYRVTPRQKVIVLIHL